MSYIRKIKKGNKVYLAEVESKWINGKSVQKHIRYIGKEIDGKVIHSISLENLQVEQVKIYGPLAVFHELAKQIDLPNILGEYSNEILSMVYAHCMDYKSIRKMPKWYERTDLNTLLSLKNLTESRLYSALDELNEDVIAKYQKQIFSNVKKIYKLSSKGLVYDLTNTYFSGKNCLLGKMGKSKEGKRQNPLIQIGLITTQKEGVPVFHKTFKGNIHDSRTLDSLSDNFSKCNLEPGLIVYDRGIASAKNLISIGKLGWDTLCGISIKNKEKETIRKIFKKESINKFSNMVKINRAVLYTKGVSYNYGGVKGKLVICFNEKRKMEIRENRRLEIFKAQKLLSKKKNIKDGLRKYLTPTGRLRNIELDKAEEFDGFSCVFCTKNMADEEMVLRYFDKDIVEKAFMNLKGVSNLHPIRFWLKSRVIAHVFICYLSYLLFSLMKYKLKDLDISPEDAIEDLQGMYNVYLYDKKNKNRFVKSVTLSKHQEKILKSISRKLVKR